MDALACGVCVQSVRTPSSRCQYKCRLAHLTQRLNVSLCCLVLPFQCNDSVAQS